MIFVMGFGSYKYTPPRVCLLSRGPGTDKKTYTSPLFLVYSPCWLIYGAFVVSGISLLGARHSPEEVGMRGEGKS